MFLIAAKDGGRYYLWAERIAYAALRTESFDLLPGDTLAVELRFSDDPVSLAPLIVASDRLAIVRDAT